MVSLSNFTLTLYFLIVFRRHRIVSPGAEGIASENTQKSEPGTFPESMDQYCLCRINRTCGSKPAARRKKRRNNFFVKTDKNQKESGRGEPEPELREGVRHSAVMRCFSSFVMTSGMETLQIALLGMTRIRHGFILGFKRRTASVMILRARFLTTAFLWNLRLQMTPKRTPSKPGSVLPETVRRV